jgi:hypothetical protein
MSCFEKIAILCFGAHFKGPIFGDGMFRFSGHQPMMDELLNTKYE